MEGTETDWGRAQEPPPRWRALLDRALLGGRTGEHAQVDADRAARGMPGDPGRGLPGDPAYPANALNGQIPPNGYQDPKGYPEGGNGYGSPNGYSEGDIGERSSRRGGGYFESGPPGGGAFDAPVPPPDNPLPRRPHRPPSSSAYGAPVNGRQQDPLPPGRPGPADQGPPRRQPYPPAGPGFGAPSVQPPPVALGPGEQGLSYEESRYAALDPRYSPVQPPRYPPMPPAGPPAAAIPPAPLNPPGGDPRGGDLRGGEPRGGDLRGGDLRGGEPRYGGPPQAYVAPPPPPERDYPLESRYAALAPPGYTPPPAPVAPPAPPPAVVAPPPVAEPPTVAQPAQTRFQTKDVGFLGGAPEPTRSPDAEWGRSTPAMDRETERAVSVLKRDMGGPRVMAFANPKGGVHKTTATALASAAVGSVRGKGVLAWDDNELRGTLGLRAGSARHARTVRHLISELAQIEITHGAELLDRLDDFLRHASDGSYDVLAGEENPRFAQRLDQHTVRRVLELLRRTHDVICVDTGNNVESVNWQTVLQAADQLVVTTVPREDAAFTADWMLDLLDDVGMGDLVSNAVTLISCPTPGKSPLLDDLEKHFKTRTRAVAIVPYDPALETGASIEYHQLQPETRNAWLRATSMMLEPFAR